MYSEHVNIENLTYAAAVVVANIGRYISNICRVILHPKLFFHLYLVIGTAQQRSAENALGSYCE